MAEVDDIDQIMAEACAEINALENETFSVSYGEGYQDLSSELQSDVALAMKEFEKEFMGVNGELNEAIALSEVDRVIHDSKIRLNVVTGCGKSRLLHDIVGTIEKRSLRGRVVETTAKVVLKGSTDAVNQGRLLDVLNSFKIKVEELYRNLVVSKSRAQDKAQMILFTSSMENPISTRLILVSDLTPGHLLAKVQDAQQSSLSINVADDLQVHFVHLKCDPGWEDELDELRGAGRTPHLLLFDRFFKKTSTVNVPNVTPTSCLAQALVIGTALADYERVKTVVMDKKKGSTARGRQTPEEREKYDEYRQLTSNHRKNNEILLKKVNELHEAAGVLKDCPADIEALKKFESVLQIRVKVVSLQHLKKLRYEGAPSSRGTVYLAYSKKEGQDSGHYTLISNICGFFSKKLYCTVCDISYNNKYDHRCADIEDFCFSCYNRNCQKVNGRKAEACQSCHLPIRSEACRKGHKALACSRKWKCEKCSRNFTRPKKVEKKDVERFLNDSEMEELHFCNQYFCSECEKFVTEDHFCYMKRRGFKPKTNKLMFFDFETRQETGEHIVNYIHCRYFVPTVEERSDVKKKGGRPKTRYFQDGDDSHLSDDKNWSGNWLEKSFKGEKSLQGFLEFLTETKQFNGYTVIAHNLRGYDGIFVLKELLNSGSIPKVIVRGQKIMMLSVPDCNVRFIDSFNFLPMSLSKLPGAFGLSCGSKGYFPHFFNTLDNWGYNGKLPEPDMYGVDSMSASEKIKFSSWYESQKEAGSTFNLQEELSTYCRQDVVILAESCLAYRRLMCLETACDPFQYLTCASVCKAVFKAKFLPEMAIARVPCSGYSGSKYSDESLEYLEYLRVFEGIQDMRHVTNSEKGEKKIGRFFVDGFSQSLNTVYEYHGCIHHGCRSCFAESSLRHPLTKKLLTQVYKETVAREIEIRQMGFNVVSIWGCQWAARKKDDPELSQKVKLLQVPTPLNPRDAFFGGRTESFRLFCDEGEMSYEDVTSLYPWVNFTKEYPVGHPTIITHDFGPLEGYFGIVKCKILPPSDLYLPVLPRHCGINKKLVFPLCAMCADNFQVDMCRHSAEERALTGTWFSEELKLAVRKGYRVFQMFTVWHFEKRTKNLFKDYVKTFYRMKLLSSKLPFEEEENIRKYIEGVSEKEGIEIGSPEDFKENPGLRQLSKLMLNNLWGRFGMRENLSKSVFVTDMPEVMKYLNDETVEVEGVRIASENVCQLIYKTKDQDFLDFGNDTNIFVAIVTTGWARIRLYEELEKLDERCLYCDTDSVVYVKSFNPSENLQIGPYLGEMTDELDSGDSICSFVSGGPKNYAYRTTNGKTVVKIKGFSLNATNAPVFSFDNVKDVIFEGVHMNQDDEVDDVAALDSRRRFISARRRQKRIGSDRSVFMNDHENLGSDKASAIPKQNGISAFNPRRIFRTRDWRVMKKPEQKFYSFCFDKRIVLTDYNTVPYGYLGPLG